MACWKIHHFDAFPSYTSLFIHRGFPSQPRLIAGRWWKSTAMSDHLKCKVMWFLLTFSLDDDHVGYRISFFMRQTKNEKVPTVPKKSRPTHILPTMVRIHNLSRGLPWVNQGSEGPRGYTHNIVDQGFFVKIAGVMVPQIDHGHHTSHGMNHVVLVVFFLSICKLSSNMKMMDLAPINPWDTLDLAGRCS